MSTEREQALAALREWSVPGCRADLVEAAWRAGATVVAIAEAARAKSRQTIYDDLKSRGIDPRRDRPKETDMTISPVTIEGITGTDAVKDSEVTDAAVRRIITENPGMPEDEQRQRFVTEFKRLGEVENTLRWYNTLRSQLLEEQVAREERDRALHLVEVRWEALADPNSKGSWLHGHQAYVRAVDDARIAIDMWEERATAAAKSPGAAALIPDGNGEYHGTYRRILDAGHPVLTVPGTDPAAVAEQLRANLDQAHEHRQRQAGQTLGLATAQN
ncbi:hypothetical protein [Streptomyces sp. NBC_01304]|uniref:hypothetical protein n=1 Tax=Streptomyces sp. NBC_01304 TaxID=2903818 RepID=UPI002E15A99F|nr:hypothetical protein OG430_49025 [Streptomyces sp. NBC_01304]